MRRKSVCGICAESQITLEANGTAHDVYTIPVDEQRNGNTHTILYKSNDPISSPDEDKVTKILKNDCVGHGVEVKHPTSFLETLIHMFKGNIGPGLFAIGDAFKNSGILLGPIFLPILGLICVHCQHQLINASVHLQEKLNLKRNPGFTTTVELCFATGPPKLQKFSTFSRRLVNLFLCLTQLGFCCVCFVFTSTNLKQIMDSYGYVYSLHIHMAVILVPVLISCLIRNLKYLVPLSIVANVVILTGIAATLYYTAKLPYSSTTVYVADIGQLPLFFGTALYAFEGVGLVLPLQNEMKKPQQFDRTFGVLNVGMIVVTSFYLIIGTFSYLKYGSSIHGSVTLDLPQDEGLAQGVKGMIALAVLCSFALQFYIPIKIMLPFVKEYFSSLNRPVVIEMLLRIVFVLITFGLAEIVPFLDLFITLIGAICSTAVALFIPPILELITKKITPMILIKNVIILGIGLVGCVTGSFQSIRMIIKAFQEERAE